MNESPELNILLISVVLTFFGTMYTIYYTRKNLKTSKYIDSITSERIKWLEIIRNEAALIITKVHISLKIYSDDIMDYKKNAGQFENSDFASPLDAKTSSAFGQEKATWSQSDYIYFLQVFKLRLNPIENKDITLIVDFFIKFYVESEKKSEKELPEAKEKINQLIEQTQILLKQEWEKVKQESRGKILIKKK